MSILPRKPNWIDWVIWSIVAIMFLYVAFYAMPTIANTIFPPPAPDEIIKFYANGTALLGNGTLINLSGMELR